MDRRSEMLLIIIVLLGALSLLLVLPLLQYVMAAALVAFVLHPIHLRLTAHRFLIRGREVQIGPRTSALLLTTLGVLAGIIPLILLSILVLQTVISFVEELDYETVIETARIIARDLGVDDGLMAEYEDRLLGEIESLVNRGLDFVLGETLSLVNTSIQVALGLLVLVFLLYYFILDGRALVGWLGGVTPLADSVQTRLIAEVKAVTWAVMKSHVLIAVVEGVLGGIGLYLLGVPNVVFWTVVMIIVSFLPAIGIWLIWGPAVGYLVLVGEPVNAVLLLLYGILVLSIVDNYLRAMLVDRSAGVHPAIVLIGVIGGIYVFGILGLFLGPVLLAVFKATIEVFGEVSDSSDASVAEHS